MSFVFNMTGGGGGSGGTLVVTAPVGVTVTATKGDKTYTRIVNAQGKATFKGLSSGTWMLSIDDATHEPTTPVPVEIRADYTVTLNFFSATINITYPAASTCVVKNSGGETVASDSNTGGDAKTWTATVTATGTYTVTATATDGSGNTKSSNVSITTDGQSESVTLAYFSATINITYPAASTCVVKNSGGETVASDSNTGGDAKTWTATVTATGTYTVTATATDGSGNTISSNVSITADGQSESVELSYQFVLFDISGNYNGSWKGYAYRPSTSSLSPLAPTVSILSDGTMQTSLSGTERNGLNANDYQIDFSKYKRLYAEMYADFTYAEESSIQVVDAIKNNYNNPAYTKTTKLREWETLSVDVSNITTTGYVTIWLYVNTGTNKCITRKVWLE